MAITRAELSRITGYQNPYVWAVANDAGAKEEEFSKHRYYFLDRIGSNVYGDTALHRLLALHASSSVVRNFILHSTEHLSRLENNLGLGPYAGLPNPPSVDQVNELGVTALHVVVYRNSWHVDEIVKLLLQECPRLASMPMDLCGSYPLHILAGHSVTVRERALHLLLKASGAKAICWKEDCDGNNPLCLLWKNVLRFSWARLWEELGVVPSVTTMKVVDLSWMTVITPCEFLEYSLAILHTAYGGRKCGGRLSWHDVCGFPRCPPLLVRLLLQQQPSGIDGSLLTKDDEGRLPLHLAAESLAVNYSSVSPSIARRASDLIHLLLQVGSASAAVADNSGRFALHYACQNKCAESLASLIVACPDALRVADSSTGLFPAQQVATRRDLMCQTDITYQMVHACPEIMQYEIEVPSQ